MLTLIPLVLTLLTAVSVITLVARQTTLRGHVLTVLGLAALSIVVGNATALVLIAIVTIGIGAAAIIVLVNATFYYALALPGLALADRARLTGSGWWTTVLLLPMVASALPPHLSRSSAERLIQQNAAAQIEAPLPPRVRLVSLTDRRVYAPTDQGSTVSTCQALCQSLLVSRYAERVRINFPEDHRHDVNAYDFRLVPLQTCPETLPDNEVPQLELVGLAAEGICLMKERPDATRPDLAIVHRTVEDRQGDLLQTLHLPRSDEITIEHITDGASPRTLWHKIDQKVEQLSAPLALVPTGGLSNNFAWDFARERRGDVKADWADTTLAALVPDSAAAAGPLSHDAEHLRREQVLMRLLDSPVTGPYPTSVSRLTSEWAGSATRASSDQTRVDDLFVRIASDTRFNDIPTVFTNLPTRPHVLARTLPALMQRLENPPASVVEAAQKTTGHYDFDRANIGYAMAVLPAETLAPYGPRIVNLIAGSTESWTAGLVGLLGRLPGDHTALIQSRLQPDLPNQVRDRAAMAVCLAQPDVQAALRTDLVKALERAAGERSGRDRLRPLVAALIRMGDRPTVVEILGGETHDVFRYLKHKGQPLETGFPAEACRG